MVTSLAGHQRVDRLRDVFDTNAEIGRALPIDYRLAVRDGRGRSCASTSTIAGLWSISSTAFVVYSIELLQIRTDEAYWIPPPPRPLPRWNTELLVPCTAMIAADFRYGCDQRPRHRHEILLRVLALVDRHQPHEDDAAVRLAAAAAEAVIASVSETPGICRAGRARCDRASDCVAARLDPTGSRT